MRADLELPDDPPLPSDRTRNATSRAAHRGSGTPTEQLQAVLLAAACALLFLGAGVRTDRALVPFPPELFEPAWSTSTSDAPRPDLLVGNPSQGDKYGQSLAWDRTTAAALRAGGPLPAWSPDIAGGAPFVPQMAQPFEPWNLLLQIPGVGPVGWYGLFWLLHMVAFGWTGYRATRRVLGVADHQAALVGVVVLCLGMWTQARIHHNVMVSAAWPIFLMLGSVHDLFAPAPKDAAAVAARLRSAAVFALATGLAWLGGFPPAAWMATFAAGTLALVHAAVGLRAGRPVVAPLLTAVTAGVLGLLVAAPQLVPTLVAAADTARGSTDPAELWARSLSPAHLATAVWPDLLYWPSPTLADVGDERRAWAAMVSLPFLANNDFSYVETSFAPGMGALAGLGALPLALWAGSASGPSPGPRAARWTFAGLGLFGLGVAFAWPPFFQSTALLPGARAGLTTRFLFLFAAMAGPLAAAGLAAARRRGLGARTWAAWLPALAALASVPLAALALVPDGVFLDGMVALSSWAFDAPEAFARRSLSADPGDVADNRLRLAVTGIRALVAAGVCLAALRFAPRRAGWWIAAVTALELWHAGRGPVVAVETERVTRPPRILRPLVEADREAEAGRAPPPRVVRLLLPPGLARGTLAFLPPNLPAFHGLSDLCAYNPLPPRRMEEWFLAVEPDREGKPSAVIGGAGTKGLYDPASLRDPLLDLIGCTHVLVQAKEGLPTALASAPFTDRTPTGVAPGYFLLERAGSWPRATFVDAIRLVPDRKARLALLRDATAEDLRRTAVVERPVPGLAAPMADGEGRPGDASVQVVSWSAEEVVVEVTCDRPGLVRLADPWDPGWTATVDGRPVPVLVADHYVRAVPVPAAAGQRVVFRYDDWLLVRLPRQLGLGAALLGLLAFAGAAALAAAGRRRDGGEDGASRSAPPSPTALGTARRPGHAER